MKDLVEFKIKPEELPLFLIYFILGILHSIKNNKISPDVGIWTIAHPSLQRFLEDVPSIPQELLEIIEGCDEFSLGDQVDYDFISEQIVALEKMLEGYKDHNVFPSFHWLSGLTPEK